MSDYLLWQKEEAEKKKSEKKKKRRLRGRGRRDDEDQEVLGDSGDGEDGGDSRSDGGQVMMGCAVFRPPTTRPPSVSGGQKEFLFRQKLLLTTDHRLVLVE